MSWGERLKLLVALAIFWAIIIYMSLDAIMSECALHIYSMGIVTGLTIAMTVEVAKIIAEYRQEVKKNEDRGG